MVSNAGIQYIPVSSWTMEVQGAKQVEITGLKDKRQITAVFAVTASIDYTITSIDYIIVSIDYL